MIGVAVEGSDSQIGPLLLEDYCDNSGCTGFELQRSLFESNENGKATLKILNTGGFTKKVPKGTVVGKAVEVCSVDKMDYNDGDDNTRTKEVRQVQSGKTMDNMETQKQKKLLLEILGNST